MPACFTVSSDLAAPPARVWSHASSFAGINAELWPLAMSAPAAYRGPGGLDLLIPRVPGRRLLVSWISLLGVIPFDRHRLGLDALDPEAGFNEHSDSLMNAMWRHTRTLTPTPGGCRVTDIVEVRSRVPGLHHLLRPVYRLVFRRRHAVLRRLFGPAAVS